MSTYLTIYGIQRKNTKPIPIVSFHGNHNVFQEIYESIRPIACYSGEQKYTELTIENLEDTIKDIKENIDKENKRIAEYEKYAASNPDYIEEILQMKEYRDGLQQTQHHLEFIEFMVQETNYNYEDGFEKIVCNID